MKHFKLLITILFMFSLVGCGSKDQPTSVKEGENSPSEEVVEEVEGLVPNKEDVMVAFKFWVNKRAWQYEDDTYLDKETLVEIYYDDLSHKMYSEDYDEWVDRKYDPEDDEWFEVTYGEEYRNKYYHAYVYYPLKKDKKGKETYKVTGFRISKTGFNAEADIDEVRKIGKELTYLGQETFHFKSTDVSKPEYPVSSPMKEAFIEVAKERVNELILVTAKEGDPVPSGAKIQEDDRFPDDFPAETVIGPGKYEVYIENFTEEESSVYVAIKSDAGELFSCDLSARYLDEAGKWIFLTIKEFETKENMSAWVEYFLSSGNWSDKEMRNHFKKTMQLAVADFEVEVPE